MSTEPTNPTDPMDPADFEAMAVMLVGTEKAKETLQRTISDLEALTELAPRIALSLAMTLRLALDNDLIPAARDAAGIDPEDMKDIDAKVAAYAAEWEGDR